MTHQSKRIAKRLLAFGLYYSGLLWAYAAICLRHRGVVLTYHRVLPASSDSYSVDGIRVLPPTFARHMAFLRKHFQILSVSELAFHLESKQDLPRWSCVVTFDDGWHDNYEHALPILRRERIPAAIFVATDYVGNDRSFWQERVARRMHSALLAGGVPGAIVVERTRIDFDSLDPSRLKSAVRAAVTRMKILPSLEIEAFENELCHVMRQEHVVENPPGDDRFMSWKQLAYMTQEVPISIGAHGCSHMPLPTLSDEKIALELSSCREQIAESVGVSTVAIAYPDGRFTPAVAAKARDAGFRIGFTTQPGFVTARDNPFLLNRINVHESSSATIPEFFCTLLGLFHVFGRPDNNARIGHGQ